MLQSVNFATQAFSPLVGDIADKMPPLFSKYFGRRRPFVLFGHLTYFAGLVCSYNGLCAPPTQPKHNLRRVAYS